jgi:hypothetical protein
VGDLVGAKMRLRALSLLACCLLTLNANAVAAEQCPVSRSFEQPDVEVESGRTITYQRAVRFDDDVVIFSEGLHVNTDGNLRSYNAFDPRAKGCVGLDSDADPIASRCAMNTVCHGAYVWLRRPDATEVKLDHSRCADLAAEFERIRDAGWLPPDGSRVEFYAIETLGRTGSNRYRPCIDANGFMTSTASTMSGLDGGACAQGDYLDALVPSIVVPKCWTRAYRTRNPVSCERALPQEAALDLAPGDLVALVASDGSDVHFGVIGDTGPNRKLGEASVGMHMELRGRPEPRTLAQSYALRNDGRRYHVVIFRNSRFEGTLTPENASSMRAAAEARFGAWTGSPEASAARLAACGA